MPRSPWPYLAAGWVAQILFSVLAIAISNHEHCLDCPGCPMTTGVLPEGSHKTVYAAGIGIFLILLILHVSRFRDPRYACVSLFINSVLVFCSFVLYLVFYMGFGHWHP